MRERLRIPLGFVAAHTSLLLLTAIAVFLSQSGSDSTIGAGMACITMFAIDYPIGLLLEALRPYWSNWSDGGALLAIVFLYGVLGNAMWFVFGSMVRLLVKCW